MGLYFLGSRVVAGVNSQIGMAIVDFFASTRNPVLRFARAALRLGLASTWETEWNPKDLQRLSDGRTNTPQFCEKLTYVVLPKA
jgi:hypothetical protein